MKKLLIGGVSLVVVLLAAALIRTEQTASEPPNPEAIARAYLQQNRLEYGLSSQVDDLDLVYTKESLGAYHVRFQQTFSGIPVFGALTTVNITKGTDQVSLVLNRYALGVTPVATNATVSQDQAIAIASAAVGASELRGTVSAEQVYFPEEKSYYLAWQVTLPALDPLGDWLVMVRADSGEVLLKQNLIVDDTGQVFDPNPVQTGAPPPPPPPYDCDSAANATTLSPEYRSRTLLGIQSLQDNLLIGQYVNLCAGIGGAYKASCQADEASRSYVYACNDDRFEEVMVYYHVDAAQRKIQSLGFTGNTSILNKPIRAHAHYTSDCNAFYSPLDVALLFGDSDRMGCPQHTDAAEDAEVIVHEYGHALQNDQVPGWGIGDPLVVEQAKAIGEGFGDFLASAIYGDPCQGEWFSMRQTACGGQPGLRWLQNTKVYPADFNACPNAPYGGKEEHCAGEIWGGALWDLVEALGDNQAARDLVLRLVLESHFYLDPQSDFAEGASAIRQADIDLYGGTHVSTINSVFAGRGIVSTGPISDFPYAYLRIWTTPSGIRDLLVHLKAGPNPGAPLCDLLLWNRQDCGNVLPVACLVGYVGLTGTSCASYLPPSVGTPWWLEAQNVGQSNLVGYIAGFEVALSGTRRCVATDVPVNIPDNDGVVRSKVDCTTIRESLPTPTRTPTPTVTGSVTVTPTSTRTFTPTPSPTPPPGGTFVYDQTDNPGGWVVLSQNFEAVNDDYDSQAADDFAVPPSDGAWTIQTIQILGAYWNGAGPLTSVNVWFYENAGSLPGTQVFSQPNLVPTSDSSGDLVLDLPIPPTLPAGTYWLSVQANMDLATGGQWGWMERLVQSYSPWAWRNPGNGLGTGCTAWTTHTSCGFSHGPDLLFRLSGTKGTVCPGDADCDGILDSVDNCPSVYNPGQENTDAAIDNGPGIPGHDTTIPNAVADSEGDACETDPDIDHDGLPNSEDTDPLGATGICAAFAPTPSAGHPHPAGGDVTNDDDHDGDPAPPMGADASDNGPSWDTDNDGALDGVECTLGHNPRNRADRPSEADCGGAGDTDGDGLLDAWEKCGWGTNPNVVDSDGDTRGDCTEAVDTNGNGIILGDFAADALNSARAAVLPAGTGPGHFGKTMDFDLNGNGLIVGDFGADTLTTAKMTLGLLTCK